MPPEVDPPRQNLAYWQRRPRFPPRPMAQVSFALSSPAPVSAPAPALFRRVTRWFPAACAALYLWIGLRDPTLFVDFFGFIDHADHLPRRWLDGFYPVGYPLLLRTVFWVVGDFRLAGILISVASAWFALRGVQRLGTSLGRGERPLPWVRPGS